MNLCTPRLRGYHDTDLCIDMCASRIHNSITHRYIGTSAKECPLRMWRIDNRGHLYWTIHALVSDLTNAQASMESQSITFVANALFFLCQCMRKMDLAYGQQTCADRGQNLFIQN